MYVEFNKIVGDIIVLFGEVKKSINDLLDVGVYEINYI